jgi:hypothetical protein
MEKQTGIELFADISKRAGVTCVLIGGFAVNYYNFTRQTADIDFLLTEEDFFKIKKSLEDAGKMDRATILRAAQDYLHADGVKIFVVGDVDKFQPPLSAFGQPVHEIELKDPTKM